MAQDKIDAEEVMRLVKEYGDAREAIGWDEGFNDGQDAADLLYRIEAALKAANKKGPPPT